MSEQELIAYYVSDYRRRTGKKLIAYTTDTSPAIQVQAPQEKLQKMPLQDLYKKTIEVYDIECLKNTRRREYVMVRNILFRIGLEMGHTSVSIAQWSGLDHTTVLRSKHCKPVQEKEWIEEYNRFRELIKNSNNGNTYKQPGSSE